MSWPLASHFSAMLQSPRVAFRDPLLQQATIEKNAQNQPRPWAGQFAVVYKGIHAENQTPFAVRVFTTESPERHERYDSISAYLKSTKVSCLVDFEYHDRSIRSAGDGKWYPLILMDWVQGDTLFHWVRARAQEGNGEALAALADRWLDATNELAAAHIAHGDLQHANIMVTPAGQIKLVDYDGMCVPALVGRHNLEVGVEPYQHPDRNEHTLLSMELDRFSVIMIYTGLRALAEQPGLWPTYVEQAGYDKLLFRREDFQNPEQSPLYRDLMGLPNREVVELVRQLFGLWRARIDQVPPLSQLVGGYRRVEQYLHEHRWEAAVELLNRRGHFRDAPANLQPLIRQAYEHVCRNEAWLKFAQIPGEASEPVDRQLVQAWNESLFAGFPAAEQERMRVAEARRRVRLVDRLCHLAQQIGGKILLAGEKSLVAAAAELPQGYKFSLRERVEHARRRVTVFTRLERVLQEPLSEAAIVAAWRSMVEARCEPLVSMEWGVRIALAEERAPVMRSLAEIPRDIPAAERDARLLALWRDDLLADCREADRWRPYYQRAVARKVALPLVQAAVTAGDEVALVELAQRPCLQGYALPPEWTAAIEAARAHAAEAEKLLALLADGQPADGQPADGRAEAIRALFDVAIIRRRAAQFAPYEPLLSEAIRAELAANPQLGMQLPAEGAAVTVVDEPEGNHRVRWNWPSPRWADRCLVAICAEPPADDADAEAVPAHWRTTIEHSAATAAAGQLLAVERGWEGSYVVVWALVDLGPSKFTSRPLLLGQIEHRARWSWKGLRRVSG